MKNTFLLFVFLLLFFSCKAQQEYPLNSFPQNLPAGSYIKDFNNKQNPYIGTYKANFNSNEITLNITKEIKRPFNLGSNIKFFKDALIIRYVVKNVKGEILQSTIGSTEDSRNFIFDMSFNTMRDAFSLYYTGTNCGVGNGQIFIKLLNSSQLNWSFYPNDITLTKTTCPGNPDLTIYLPEAEDLVFTRQ